MLRVGTPSVMSGLERLRSGPPPNAGQQGCSTTSRCGGGLGGRFTGVVSVVTTVTAVGATRPPFDGARTEK
jgi:hypothetical protein